MQNIKLIKLLGSNKWDEQIMQLCKTFKVTHIIIHKNYNYPKNIPFEKTFIAKLPGETLKSIF